MTARRGFTLIEILAALAVFGILLVALAQGVQFGQRAGALQSREAARREAMETVDRSLRLLIRRVTPGDEQAPLAAIQGDAHAMDLLTELPAATGPVPSRLVSARLMLDARARLVLRWQPSPHAEWLGPPAPVTEEVLVTGVAGLDIAYWQEAPGGGGVWRSAWTETNLPSLVRLRVRLFGAAAWPDIIAAPALDQG